MADPFGSHRGAWHAGLCPRAAASAAFWCGLDDLPTNFAYDFFVIEAADAVGGARVQGGARANFHKIRAALFCTIWALISCRHQDGATANFRRRFSGAMDPSDSHCCRLCHRRSSREFSPRACGLYFGVLELVRKTELCNRSTGFAFDSEITDGAMIPHLLVKRDPVLEVFLFRDFPLSFEDDLFYDSETVGEQEIGDRGQGV